MEMMYLHQAKVTVLRAIFDADPAIEAMTLLSPSISSTTSCKLRLKANSSIQDEKECFVYGHHVSQQKLNSCDHQLCQFGSLPADTSRSRPWRCAC